MGSEGLKEGEEVELELGLSLGGSYGGNGSRKEGETRRLQKVEGKRKREENEMNNGVFRDRDFEEEEGSRRVAKKNNVNNNDLIQNDNGSVNQNMQVQYSHPYFYPYPQYQGFVFPYGNGVVNPVMGYGFVPFQAGTESGFVTGNGLEQNGGRKEGKNKDRSGSSVRSSSGSSDRKKSSCEGGGSNDSRSHSICSLPEQCSGSKLSSTPSISEHSATSHLNNYADHPDGFISSNSSQSGLSGPKEATLETEPKQTSKKDSGKPPKPQMQKQSTPPPSFSFMPFVSTRGDGPDGKTVNGFLHRCTKTEVTIICMCHGRALSPAEFVEHAGGKAVSNPSRHITVMPPAC